MNPEEIKAKTDDMARQIAGLEQTELTAYAELGQKLLPEIAQNSEHAPLVEQIRATDGKLAALREELAALETEYKKRLAALTCFSCKALNQEGAAFCEACGTKLGVKPKEYCEGCGTLNRPDQKFCGECGAKLATE